MLPRNPGRKKKTYNGGRERYEEEVVIINFTQIQKQDPKPFSEMWQNTNTTHTLMRIMKCQKLETHGRYECESTSAQQTIK